MNLLQQVKEINWMHPYRRRTSIHKLDLYVLNMSKEIKRFFGTDFNNLLAIGHGFDLKWYFDGDQFDKLGKAVCRKTLLDVRQRTNHINQIKQHASIGVRSVRGWDKLDITGKSNLQLLKMVNFFSGAIDKINPILYAPLVIDRDLFSHVKDVLSKYFVGKKLTRAFEIAINPIKPTPISRTEIDLCQACIKAKENYAQAAKQYFNKYKWIGMRFVDNQPRSPEYYEEQIKKSSLVYCRKFIKRQNLRTRKAQTAYLSLLKSLSQLDRRLIKLVNQYSSFRHERDLYRDHIYYSGHFLYKEISKRYNLPITDILYYTVDELKRLLINNKRLTSAEIKRRKKKFAFIVIKGNTSLITDQYKIKMIEKNSNENTEFPKISSKLRGMGTYPGVASGKVKLIRLSHVAKDLRDIMPNNILVAESTKPEYLPAMKKAAAVVTNEGGLTCHAAIVSREFRIPTVVGTKRATDVFKDGDYVEVDADKGIVSKIEKPDNT